MRAFFGFLQVGLFVWGVVEAFNGRWWMLVIAWLIAAAIGVLGARIARNPDGTSVLAKTAIETLERGIQKAEAGEFQDADRYITTAIRDLRLGNEWGILCTVLPAAAIIKAQLGDSIAAADLLVEADRKLDKVPENYEFFANDMRLRIHFINQEISYPDSDKHQLLMTYLAYVSDVM